MRRLIVAALLVACAATTVVEGQTGRGSAPMSAALAETFVRDLQAAVQAQDARRVAAMVRYPANVFASPFNIPVKTADEFLKGYSNFFSPELQAIISLSGVARPGQPAPIFPVATAGDTVAFGGRFLSANLTQGALKIARIVIPPAWDTGPSVRNPFPVRFQTGQAAARFSGTLQRYQVASYTLVVAAGSTLQASLYGGADQDVILRVLGPDGKPVDDKSRIGARIWTGNLPRSGSYRVDVIGVAPENKSATYRLAINVRDP